jgi:hypothetical protein
MKVQIKDFGVELQVKNKGLEVAVADPKGKHLGDLFLTGTCLIWCKGRTRKNQGRKIKWEKFIEEMQKPN